MPCASCASTLHLPSAAQTAPQLLREARRVSRQYIILVEDVFIKGEHNPRESTIHRRHKKHGMVKGFPRGIFRTQYEWTSLLQSDGEFTVTRVGAVMPRNITGDFRSRHRLSGQGVVELTGPTYQRYFGEPSDSNSRAPPGRPTPAVLPF